MVNLFLMFIVSLTIFRKMPLIFPELPKSQLSQLLIIPVYQPSAVDLVGIGSHVEAEKERLLQSVSIFFDYFRCLFFFPLLSHFLFSRPLAF